MTVRAERTVELAAPPAEVWAFIAGDSRPRGARTRTDRRRGASRESLHRRRESPRRRWFFERNLDNELDNLGTAIRADLGIEV